VNMSERSSLFPKTALVTGSAGGIGQAIVERLEREGASIHELDLVTGFDVTDPTAWQSVDRVELACLNAGVTTSTASIAELTREEYRRVVGVNVDGVVYGARRMAREMEDGDAIVVTASLAGLTAVENDPIYALTKHAVVGFVRSVAPQLAERGIRINAVCPGFADTPMVAGELRSALESAEFPLLTADEVAEAVLRAARSEGTGEAWVVQPGRDPEPYRFRGIPGPRVAGKEGLAPPVS
jgi:NAD(P)-dependent dehydrogenase (short-subunit alcohol dehydrogenase family)